MYTQPETPAALLASLAEALLLTPAGMLLVIVLLTALLLGARRQPTPAYTVVTVQPAESGPSGAGCLPLLVLVLVILLAITAL